MTLQPAPAPGQEGFGNPWMARLQEIQPPEAVPGWPPAPGWYLLAAAGALLCVWVAWRVWRRVRRDAYRREALARLDGIEARLDERGAAALGELPGLIKRVALGSHPRAEVASLSGDALLEFLDGGLGTTEFTRGPGRVLPRIAYEPAAAPSVPAEEARALVALTRRWIRRHRGSRRG